MRIALVQIRGEAVHEFAATAERIYAAVERAVHSKPDLVLLPECAFPSYLVAPEPGIFSRAIEASVSFLERISGLAARHGIYITAGVACRRGETLYNAAVTFDRNGREIDFAAKSNLWHFDDTWFAPGSGYSTFETEFGTLGSMICADGRVPEISAILARRGAKLILDPVNLVATAETPAQLSNQQYEFMLQARARENGVFIAVCDKCGVEAGVVSFLGRSCIVGPDGSMPAQASPDREEILIADLDLSAAAGPSEHSRAIGAGGAFGILAEPTGTLPVSAIIDAPYKVEDLAVFTMIARFRASSAGDYAGKTLYYASMAKILRAPLLLLPELPEPSLLDEEVLAAVRDGISPGHTVVLAGTVESAAGRVRRAVVLVRDAHGKLDTKWLSSLPVMVASISGAVRLAVCFDAEAEIPEIARSAMLGGADILLCYDSSQAGEARIRSIRTRAAENKIFAARISCAVGDDSSSVFNPDGARVATTSKATEHTTATYINTALSKFKSVAPGTDVVRTRLPGLYGELAGS